MPPRDRVHALDQRLDALVTGHADVLDLTAATPDAIELEELLLTARLAMQVLGEPLPRATRAKHLRMLKAAARRRREA